jgi:hypothetical protein
MTKVYTHKWSHKWPFGIVHKPHVCYHCVSHEGFEIFDNPFVHVI